MTRTFKIHPSQCHKIMSAGKGGNLSVTCQTFLKEWYAGDNEPIRSKYIDKGNMVEDELIDFAASQLGLGLLEKNLLTKENDTIIGTPDIVLADTIIDVKAAWNRKTLLDARELNTDYEWQVLCYMELFGKTEAIIFHGLIDTPEMDWIEPVYFDLPDADRWIAWKVKYSAERISQINARVLECREWIEGYHTNITKDMGRVHEA